MPRRTPKPYISWWKLFGGVLKEGLYEDPQRRDMLLELVRFRTSESGDDWRSLKDYVGGDEARPDGDLLHRRRKP